MAAKKRLAEAVRGRIVAEHGGDSAMVTAERRKEKGWQLLL